MGLGFRDVFRLRKVGRRINVRRGYYWTIYVLTDWRGTGVGYLRSLEFHALDVLSRFEHLEVQPIIILEMQGLARDAIMKDKDAKTNCFEFLDFFLEVSVLCMVLLVFGTCGDALGQLHFWFGDLRGFVTLWVCLGRVQGHTPGWRCL